jgi:two-component system cell cycle sensor histidine kinase/response regulator CckA
MYQLVRRSRKRIIGWQAPNSAYACLEVSDSGCGITAKDKDNLFDPFFSRKFTGRGMGLSVVLGIVRAHHGAVTVESKPGQRTVFRVFLPLTAETASRPAPVTQVTTLKEGTTVLLVEDEELVRELATTVLTSRLAFSNSATCST